jgi:cysteine-rich repeat protein
MEDPMPISRTARCRLLQLSVILLGSILNAAPAAAQIEIVPTFEAGTSETVLNTDVAVATDGTFLLAWTAYGAHTHVTTQRFSPAGLPLGAIQPIADPEVRYMRALDADSTGGYVLAMDDVGVTPGGLWGQRLDTAGLPVGGIFQAGHPYPTDASVSAATVASLTNGSVFVWYQSGDFHGRRFDAPGGSTSGFIVEHGNPYIVNLTTAAAGLPDGGFVLGWSYFAVNPGLVARVRVYESNANARSAIIDVGNANSLVTDVAANPTGGFAVAAIRFPNGFDERTEVVVFRYTNSGTLLGSTTLATLPADIVGLSKLAFDSAGHALVVWTEYRINGAYLRNRGRGMASDGTAFAQPFTIGDRVFDPIHTAALGDSTFVNVWESVNGAAANIVGLCTPSVAQCGDGTRVADCEECDDGAANSDVAPDACRSNCTIPRCGDGVADVAHGEECDDGNDVRCDGCTECRLEIGLSCGDGATVPGCGDEQCDDANAVVGDGCSPNCTLEQTAGSGSVTSECLVSYAVDNPTNVPLRDAHGAFSATQTCTDGDPLCDFDGGVPGSCTFHVRVCANTVIPGCPGPVRLYAWELLQPSAAKAAKHPELAAVRTAMETVPGAIVGPSERNLCSEPLGVPVPLRGPDGHSPGKLLLKDRASDYAHTRDVDKLKLICLPSPS